MICPPGVDVPCAERARWEWRAGERSDPATGLASFLAEHARDDGRVALLVGAAGCQVLAGLPAALPSPVAAVPEIVAIALGEPFAAPVGHGEVGVWTPSWTEAAHADAVVQVQERIAAGDLYQANVVGHACAPYTGDPVTLAGRVAALPGATYGGVLSGDGWTVGCASPEQLVRVQGDRVTTAPIKGTATDPTLLRASIKDRAEHVMIVDLARNDLARVAATGSVVVAPLYALQPWSGLWHAASTVSARLRPGTDRMAVLAALLPGGSVTGAPKRAACAVIAGLEPVGRGPAMGAFGVVTAQGLDLGLTIRTVALDETHVHLWAGGGITAGSDPAAEVAEARDKAAPVRRALAGQRRACG